MINIKHNESNIIEYNDTVIYDRELYYLLRGLSQREGLTNKLMGLPTLSKATY